MEMSKRLDKLLGVGPALATAPAASVADPKAFRSGRDISAWIGLVPKQNSSGGKNKLGSISKQARTELDHAQYEPTQVDNALCGPGGGPVRSPVRAEHKSQAFE